MPTPLRVLIVEDRQADAELMAYELRRAGIEFSWQRVETEDDYLAALKAGAGDPQGGPPDLILSDCVLPCFGSMRALELWRQSQLDCPFIIVSGEIGEELAVDCMKRGAADYLFKDRLGRLGQAVLHALETARLRAEQRRTEAALRARLELLVEERTSALGRANERLEAQAKALGIQTRQLRDYNDELMHLHRQLQAEQAQRERLLAENRRQNEFLSTNEVTESVLARRQSEDAQAQAEATRADAEQAQAEDVLRGAEEARLEAVTLATQREAILGSLTEGLAIAAPDGAVTSMNPAALRLHGMSSVEEARRSLADYLSLFEVSYLDGRPMPVEEWPMTRALRGETFTDQQLHLRHRKDGNTWIGSYGGTPVFNADGRLLCAIVTLRDITAQKDLEREREALLTRVQEQAAALRTANQHLQQQPEEMAVQTEELKTQNEDLVELAARLSRSESELCAARDELEQRVNERTAELSRREADLLKANKARRRQSERLQMLHQLDRAILEATAPDEIARLSAAYLRRAIPCHSAIITILEPESETLRVLAVDSAAETRLAAGTVIPAGLSRVYGESLHGHRFYVEDVSQLADALPVELTLREEGARAYFVIPLLAAERSIGAVIIWRDVPGRPSAEHEEIVVQLADSLAVALQNARLFEQVEISRSQLQALSRRLVEVQENERRAIARELHDEAGQALTAVQLGLHFLETERDPDCLAARINELKSTVDGVMENLHRLAVDLRPVSLDRAGLVPAVEQYIESFGRHSGLQVDFVAFSLDPVTGAPVKTGDAAPHVLPPSHGDCGRLDPEVETAIYRVVQEALTNVARHASAGRVSVILERRRATHAPGEALVAVIEDDGAGFDVEEALARGRLGLLGMRERVEMLGGSLTIESAPGAGTTVVVEAPCG